MYITRHMEKPVMELNEQYPVLLLTGPRQVGKTTMLEHLIEVEGKGRKKVSLDDLTLRELAKTDPKMFFQLYQPPLLIDEVQYAPELFPYIKIMVDERHQPGDFWLTGSQLFKMMEGVQESLAGRVALLHLSPLSQSEIMKRPPEPPFSLELPLLSERQNGRQTPILCMADKTIVPIFLFEIQRIHHCRTGTLLWEMKMALIREDFIFEVIADGVVCALDGNGNFEGKKPFVPFCQFRRWCSPFIHNIRTCRIRSSTKGIAGCQRNDQGMVGTGKTGSCHRMLRTPLRKP